MAHFVQCILSQFGKVNNAQGAWTRTVWAAATGMCETIVSFILKHLSIGRGPKMVLVPIVDKPDLVLPSAHSSRAVRGSRSPQFSWPSDLPGLPVSSLAFSFSLFEPLFLDLASLGLVAAHRFSSCGPPECAVSAAAVCGPSRSTACGILVAWPGTEPSSPALQGGFLTTGPPGKSHESFSCSLCSPESQ